MNLPKLSTLTRRDFTRLTLAGVPASALLSRLPLSAAGKIDSRIKGVQIGAITYSFRSITDADEIIKAYVDIGLGEMELMSNHAEQLAGAPRAGRGGGRRGAPLTPEQQAERDAAIKTFNDWRKTATEATFKPVRKKIEDAGIDLKVLCYNMNVKTTQDDEIEYAFLMAKALGVSAISTSTQVSMAKRLAKKTGKPVVITLHPIAKAILDRRRSRAGDNVTGNVFNLPGQDGSNKSLQQWIKSGGIKKHITWHCARLSFSILLQDENVDKATVALLLGHTSTKYVDTTYKRHRPKDHLSSISKLPMPEKMPSFLNQ